MKHHHINIMLWISVVELFCHGIASARTQPVQFYGVIDSSLEKKTKLPTTEGKMVSVPSRFDMPRSSLTAQGSYNDINAFIRIAFPHAQDIELRNAWLEWHVSDAFKIRTGKMYRAFGLSNEMIDLVVPYIGLEPSEIWNESHLLLSRTTNLMLHGALSHENHTLNYAMMTGNDERKSHALPLSADISYQYGENLHVGTSFYSTLGYAAPRVGLGEGASRGGVLPWMERDRFFVYGGYLRLNLIQFGLTAECFQAHHHARRDPNKVFELYEKTNLNLSNLSRFGLNNAVPKKSDIILNTDYRVTTVDLSLYYSLKLAGTWFPFLQYSFYKNPEIISDVAFGGDREVGVSDDGRLHRLGMGIIYRPISPLAIKIGYASRWVTAQGELKNMHTVAAAFSYIWNF